MFDLAAYKARLEKSHGDRLTNEIARDSLNHSRSWRLMMEKQKQHQTPLIQVLADVESSQLTGGGSGNISYSSCSMVNRNGTNTADDRRHDHYGDFNWQLEIEGVT